MKPLALGSGLLALTREAPEQAILLLCNLTPSAQRVNLDTSPLGRPRSARDLIGGGRFRASQSRLALDLAPYQCLWLTENGARRG